MPEGHTLHRAAREQTRALGGRTVAVSSPQGRFAEGAAVLDGQVLERVDAYGKHLLYRWSEGHILHVHLGLYGAFRVYRGTAPAPSAGTRLAMTAEEVMVHLSGPTACELFDPADEQRLRARLGPDPLRRGADGDAFAANLARRSLPIGASLLDQRVVAGIGNVFRAEVLFLCGIWPDRPARSLDPTEVALVWERMRLLLRDGVRRGRIVTVDPREVGRTPRSRLGDDERVYVYRRTGEPCRRCGTPIESWISAARTIYACRTCQSPR